MSAKTFRERHAKFLDHGYFAPELPPCFSSEGLGAKGYSLAKDMKSIKDAKGRPLYRRFVSDKATFYFPRFNNTDRLHSVINPISHILTSDVISRNYAKLRKLELRSKYSLSNSIFDWKGSRAIRRPLFEKRDEFTSQVSPRFEYTITTDVRSFYHSIYTHSIPWAIYGKAKAKSDRNVSLFGNELDLLVRNAQGGQTIGLPVGPDTSRILAEVIASSIDVEINRHLRVKRGDASRFVDDFTFGCNSIAEGQRMIAVIRRAIGSFELDIGKEKTGIHPTNHLEYVGWKEYMRNFAPDDGEKGKLERFFYVVHDMTKRHPNLNIDKFSMQISRKAFLAADDWKYLQDHLVSSYRRNSTLIDTLVEVLLLRHEMKHDLDLDSLTDFVSARLPVLGANQRSGEVIWLLFLCCRLGIRIPSSALVPFLREENSLIAILTSQAEELGLLIGRLDKSFWQSHANADGLRSSMFLYAYEAARRGWAPDSPNYCANDPFYSYLLKEQFSFFDLQRGFKNISDTLRDRRRENSLTRFLQAFNVDDEDEVDFDDEGFEEFEDGFDTY